MDSDAIESIHHKVLSLPHLVFQISATYLPKLQIVGSSKKNQDCPKQFCKYEHVQNLTIKNVNKLHRISRAWTRKSTKNSKDHDSAKTQIIIPIAAFHMKTTLLWQQTSLHNVCICACSHVSIHQYIFRDSSNDSKKDKNRVNK